MDNIYLKTEKLIIQPYQKKYLEEYYKEFTDEITKYQYPDTYESIEAADEQVSGFVEDMEQGEMLELVILTLQGEFLGSLEVFGLKEETPEIGLWLKSNVQGKGYGYEALHAIVNYLNKTKKYKHYIYEVDIRNLASIRLVEKFEYKKGPYEEFITESGKKLKLQTYYI